jgi:hypothetical protein
LSIGDNIISVYSKRRSKGNQFGNAEVTPTPSASVKTLDFFSRAAKAMPFEDEDKNYGSTFTNKVDDEDDDLSFLISSSLKKIGSRLVDGGYKSALPESAQLKDDEASSTDDCSDHGKNVNLSGDEKTLQDSTDDHEEADSETTVAAVETTILSSNVDKNLAAQESTTKSSAKSSLPDAEGATLAKGAVKANDSKQKPSRVSAKKPTTGTPLIHLENDNSFLELSAGVRSEDLAVEAIPLKELLGHSKRFPSAYSESVIINLKAKYDDENDAENKLLLKAVIMKFGKFRYFALTISQ